MKNKKKQKLIKKLDNQIIQEGEHTCTNGEVLKWAQTKLDELNREVTIKMDPSKFSEPYYMLEANKVIHELYKDRPHNKKHLHPDDAKLLRVIEAE